MFSASRDLLLSALNTRAAIVVSPQWYYLFSSLEETTPRPVRAVPAHRRAKKPPTTIAGVTSYDAGRLRQQEQYPKDTDWFHTLASGRDLY